MISWNQYADIIFAKDEDPRIDFCDRYTSFLFGIGNIVSLGTYVYIRGPRDSQREMDELHDNLMSRGIKSRVTTS